jgi:YteA family regulatory protein
MTENIQKMKHLLKKQRQELQSEWDHLHETGLNLAEGESTGELSTYDNHPADLGSETFERSKDSALADHARFLLERIDAALEKIENGSYGLCEDCGQAIDAERLQAVPYTVRCHTCQQRIEQADTTPRPLEETVLTPPFVRTFTDEQDQTGFDGEDALQAVMRFGSSDTLQDLVGMEDFSASIIDNNEESGLVERTDGIPALGPLGTGGAPDHFTAKKKS